MLACEPDNKGALTWIKAAHCRERTNQVCGCVVGKLVDGDADVGKIAVEVSGKRSSGDRLSRRRSDAVS